MTSDRPQTGPARRIASLPLLVAAALLLGGSTAARSQAADAATAHTARSLNGTVTAHLHLTHPSGALLFEEGATSGSLPGHMRAELDVGAVFTGRFTIYTRGGWIAGHGSASPHGMGRYQSFGGSFIVTSGGGLYKHIHGRAGLYGVFDRRTYATTIQTTGTLSY